MHRRLYVFFLLTAFLVFLLWRDFPPGTRNYEANADALCRELGFVHGSPYVRIDGKPKEVFTIASVQVGGPFHEAGVTSGDIVVGYQILMFYIGLENARGRNFTFEVVDGGDGPSIDSRTKRSITVDIPP